MQHFGECFVSMGLFTFAWNRILLRKGPNKMKVNRFFRNPAALILAGCFTYVWNKAILTPIMLNDLDEMELSKKYFSLDLNADAM